MRRNPWCASTSARTAWSSPAPGLGAAAREPGRVVDGNELVDVWVLPPGGYNCLLERADAQLDWSCWVAAYGAVLVPAVKSRFQTVAAAPSMGRDAPMLGLLPTVIYVNGCARMEQSVR